MEKSFRATELSSDDEKAEHQIEQNYLNKDKMQSELNQFEQQIREQYVSYKEPVEAIQEEVVLQLVKMGCYRRNYIMQCVKHKEMNYASAAYFLL